MFFWNPRLYCFCFPYVQVAMSIKVHWGCTNFWEQFLRCAEDWKMTWNYWCLPSQCLLCLNSTSSCLLNTTWGGSRASGCKSWWRESWMCLGEMLSERRYMNESNGSAGSGIASFKLPYGLDTACWRGDSYFYQLGLMSKVSRTKIKGKQWTPDTWDVVRVHKVLWEWWSLAWKPSKLG